METHLDLHPRRPRLTSQVVFGVLVIVLGVLFTLDNLEVLDARDYLQYWPAAFVLVGGLKLSQAVRAGHGWFGGLFFVGLGAWMLLERIVYIRLNARDLWPMCLVLLGGYMVWRGFGGGRRARPADASAHISAMAVMGGIARRSNSPAFDGADLTAIMGGCEIDLRQASITPGSEAIVDVFAFWGGIEIKVPEDWTVATSAIPLMGGVEDKTNPQQPPSGKRLVIRGLVIMGGVEVKN